MKSQPKQSIVFAIALLSVICFFTNCKKSKTEDPNPPAQTVTVSTFAGSGAAGSVNGPALTASFNYPIDVATDASGNVYVADWNNNQIRKISTGGTVSLLAGLTNGFGGVGGYSGSADGIGNMASFSSPSGVATDASGNVYVADCINGLIRKIDPSGAVSTVAGRYVSTNTPNALLMPWGLALDKSGNIFVTDEGHNLIRKITPGGVVTTLAGNRKAGFANGPDTTASFNQPTGIAVDGNDNVYVADFQNNQIRKISPSGVVSTFAGSVNGGHADGVGTAASFYWPVALTIDASGNLFVADDGNLLIRKITPSGVVTTIAGTGLIGFANGPGNEASFHFPLGIAVDASGNLFVADSYNNVIRKIVIK